MRNELGLNIDRINKIDEKVAVNEKRVDATLLRLDDLKEQFNHLMDKAQDINQ